VPAFASARSWSYTKTSNGITKENPGSARPLQPAPDPPSAVLNPYIEMLKKVRDILDMGEGENLLLALQTLVRTAGRDTTKVDKYVEEYNAIFKEPSA
jgi:hypothetical protein